MNNLSLTQCAPLALLALFGCDVNVNDPQDDYRDRDEEADVGLAPPPREATLPEERGDATLSVEWSIDGSTDPRACDDYEAASAYVTIEDDVGLVDEAEMDCATFGYDAPPLPAGTYWATVVLRDAADNDISEPTESDETDVEAGDINYLAVDFTESSFL